VAEKVGAPAASLRDPDSPSIGDRRGAAGQPSPVLQSAGIRIQTLAVGHHAWGMAPAELAKACGVPEAQVKQALAFYQAHRLEVDASVEADSQLELARA
jgi:hypothetical protein